MYYRLILDGITRPVRSFRILTEEERELRLFFGNVFLLVLIFFSSKFVAHLPDVLFAASHKFLSYQKHLRWWYLPFFVSDFEHALTRFQSQVGNIPEVRVRQGAVKNLEAKFPNKNSTLKS